MNIITFGKGVNLKLPGPFVSTNDRSEVDATQLWFKPNQSNGPTNHRSDGVLALVFGKRL